jgi:hypothetical protein
MRLEAEVVDGFDPLERVAAVTPPDFILTGRCALSDPHVLPRFGNLALLNLIATSCFHFN